MPFFHLPPFDLQKIKPTFEIRERYERRVDKDFDDATPDSRSDLFTRVRAGARFDLNSSVRAEIRYQFAQDLTWTDPLNFSTTNSDVDLAYIEAKHSGWMITVGRQKIALGQQRLIGPLEWSNYPRSFDAVRVRKGAFDAWISRIQLGPGEPDDLVLGAITRRDPRLGEASVIQKHDKSTGRVIDITTLDELVQKELDGFRLEFEGAAQFGHSAGRRQEAWALHARVGRTLSSDVQAFVEANSASGGGDADVSRTFDNLYPTNHPYYGLMDMQGWRNMNELVAGLDFSVTKSLGLRISGHLFSLRDVSDTWYAASGAANRFPGKVYQDPTGRSGRDVGRELDLEANWTVNKDSVLSAGLGLFNPGRFVERVRGSSDPQTWGYVSWSFRY